MYSTYTLQNELYHIVIFIQNTYLISLAVIFGSQQSSFLWKFFPPTLHIVVLVFLQFWIAFPLFLHINGTAYVTVLDNQLNINFIHYVVFYLQCIVAAILIFHNLAGKLMIDWLIVISCSRYGHESVENCGFGWLGLHNQGGKLHALKEVSNHYNLTF